jgi:hypothetical protein
MAQNSPSFFPSLFKAFLTHPILSLSLSFKVVVMSAMSYNGAAIIGALFFFSFFVSLSLSSKQNCFCWTTTLFSSNNNVSRLSLR